MIVTLPVNPGDVEQPMLLLLIDDTPGTLEAALGSSAPYDLILVN